MKYLIILLLFSSNLVHSDEIRINQKNFNIVQDIIDSADKVGVPREILLAICWKESSFRNKGVTHKDGPTLSHGVCQLKYETAQWMDDLYKNSIKVTPARLENSRINSLYAAQYLHYQLKHHHGDWASSVDAYNKGNVINVNSKYVKDVMSNYKVIKKKYQAKIDNKPLRSWMSQYE
jgi:hypothetical protein